ncbi:MAG: hypothetical protein LBI48_09530 [Burkholderiaceae bacterium]|jgi:hypothetical protein|nr:hypothetical protein [Burkholderiaceae bacterium]
MKTRRLAFIVWTLAACMAAGAAADPGNDASAATPLPRIDGGQPPRSLCNAQAAQFLIGQPYSPSTLAQALTAAGADTARLLRPDSFITKEYMRGRLNVTVDTGNQIVRVHCG